MKDKLPTSSNSRKRPDWVLLVLHLGLYHDYVDYWFHKDLNRVTSYKRVIKSGNRLAYIFLLSTKGREFIKLCREAYAKYGDELYSRGLKDIVNCNWIEDYV